MRAQARAFRLPGFRLVSGLGIAAQHRLVLERAAGADIVGGFINLENLVSHCLTQNVTEWIRCLTYNVTGQGACRHDASITRGQS